jgi:hypothetical protein
MKRSVLACCLVVLGLCMLPGGFAQDTTPPGSSESTKPAKKDRVYAFGMYAGKVVEVNDEEKSFVLRVYGQTRELKETSKVIGCG